MDVSDARQKLTSTVRRELRDHSFGDAEVEWFHVDGQTVIAHGYFGRDGASFSFRDGSAHFTGDEARALRDAGIEGRVFRNDETGPDDYVEGQIMPGLTKESVREEITRLREEGR